MSAELKAMARLTALHLEGDAGFDIFSDAVRDSAAGNDWIGSFYYGDEVSREEGQARIDRIVACVNACEGMEFPDIAIRGLQNHIEELREAGAARAVEAITAEQQRDELLTHLKHAVHWFDQLRKPDADRYRAAIEKVERAVAASLAKPT